MRKVGICNIYMVLPVTRSWSNQLSLFSDQLGDSQCVLYLCLYIINCYWNVCIMLLGLSQAKNSKIARTFCIVYRNGESGKELLAQPGPSRHGDWSHVTCPLGIPRILG